MKSKGIKWSFWREKLEKKKMPAYLLLFVCCDLGFASKHSSITLWFVKCTTNSSPNWAIPHFCFQYFDLKMYQYASPSTLISLKSIIFCLVYQVLPLFLLPEYTLRMRKALTTWTLIYWYITYINCFPFVTWSFSVWICEKNILHYNVRLVQSTNMVYNNLLFIRLSLFTVNLGQVSCVKGELNYYYILP